MRSLTPQLRETLAVERKMAFIAGPRQVGKTTLAQLLLKEVQAGLGYFNWDSEEDRRAIVKNAAHFWFMRSGAPPPRIVLDEIHKYPRWKSFLKGFYDANHNQVETIVAGSGRLDIHQHGGDSLFGRYHLFRLQPYSVGELLYREDRDLSPPICLRRVFGEIAKKETADAFENLWRLTGFPAPLFRGDARGLVRWQNERRQLVLRDDLRDLTRVRELGLIEALVALLPERVGVPLSLNALRINLNINFKTVQNWLAVLERLYYLFPLRPYAGRLARTLRREEKIYLYDWSEVEGEAKKFENLMAVHLLKACYYWTDAGFGDYRLHYIRDKEKREVDFLIVDRNKPWLLVECKMSERAIDRSLTYYMEQFRPRFAFQIVKGGDPSFLVKGGEGVTLCAAPRFLAALP